MQITKWCNFFPFIIGFYEVDKKSDDISGSHQHVDHKSTSDNISVREFESGSRTRLSKTS